MFIVKVGNYMNFCSKCGTKLNGDEINCNNCNFEIKKDINDLSNSNENDMKTQNKSKVTGIISLILALIPYLLFFLCYLGGLWDDDGGTIWYMIIYIWTIGNPIAFASLVCGIISYKIKANKIALVSYFINFLPLIVSIVIVILNIYARILTLFG